MELESLPEGWEMKKLEEVLELNQSGIWGEEPRKNTKSYPVIRSTEITHDCKLKVESVAYRHVLNDKIEKYRLNMGDLLVVKSSGSPNLLGRCVIFDQYSDEKVYLFSNFVQRFRTNKSTLPDFLYYFLNSYGRNFVEQLQTTTTGLRNLPISAYVSQLVSIPPIEEQNKIVEILQFADYLREKIREAKELVDKIVMSVFFDMFGDPATNPKGWEVRNLGEIAQVIMGQSPPGKSYNKNGEGFPFLQGPTEFGEFFPIEERWTTKPKKFCEDGDILISVRATIGEMSWANKQYCIGRGLAAIRANPNDATQPFLWYILKCFRNELENLGGGSVFKSIKKRHLEEFEIPLPPLDFQQEFAEIVAKLEDKRRQMEEAEEKLEMLYQILLKQAFTGKLTEEWRMRLSKEKNFVR